MTREFPEYLRKKLGLQARQISSKEETVNGTVQNGVGRVKACIGQLLKTVRIPGFEYAYTWLVREMSKQGYTTGETDEAIEVLLKRGILLRTESGLKLN